MKAIGNIYLSWRKGKGFRRYLVGVLKRNSSEGMRFEYVKEVIEKAQKDGFTPYVDFPVIDQIYTNNVIEIFGQRLMKKERTDIQSYYDFWEIDPYYKDDVFYMLAYTQGMLSTDNFEFLADFQPVANISFVTEIAGLSSRKIESGQIKPGDILSFKREPDNEYDKFAVKVFKTDLDLGYLKKVHSRIFYKKNTDILKITVKGLDQNGIINRIFVKISF